MTLAPLIQARARTLLTIGVVALGVALAFAIYLIQRSAAIEVALASNRLSGAADLIVQGPTQGFDEDLYPVIAHLPGVALASPAVEVDARVTGRDHALHLIGADAFRISRMQPALGFNDRDAASTTLADNAVFLSEVASSQLKLRKGDHFEVQIGLRSVELQVAALLPPDAYRGSVAVLDIANAQWKLQQLGRLQRIDLRLQTGADAAAVRAQLQKLLPRDVTITTPEHISSDTLGFTRAYRINLIALSLVALFTGGFLIYAVQTLATLRRTREFALLRALGITRSQQRHLVLFGALLIGVAGAAAGIALGVILARYGLRVAASSFAFGDSEAAAMLDVNATDVLGFFVLGVAVTVIASVRSAREAMRVEPALALKGGDLDIQTERGHLWLALACGIAAGVGCLLPPIAGLPLPGYAAIALVLFGTVAAMPVVMRALLGVLPHSTAVIWSNAIERLRATAKYATLSVAAILVSVALMMAMGIMVKSFRDSLDDWMQQLLPADVYLRAGLTGEAGYFSAEDLDRLRGVPAVDRVVSLRSVDILLGDISMTLLARSIDEHNAAQVIWLQTKAKQPAADNLVPVWISQSAADHLGAHVDDTIQLPLGDRLVPASVRGIFRDYDHASGAVVMGDTTYRQLTHDTHLTGISVWLRHNTVLSDAVESIRSALPLPALYELRMPVEIRARTLAIFDRTFAVTYLLEAVAVLIGLIGIGTSMSTQVLTRRAEFGVLRHLGCTRGQIGASLAIEGAGLGCVGVICGVLAGVLISFILVHVVNRQSFHWSMDVHVPLAMMLTICISLVAAAAASAVWSGRYAMSTDVIAAVKEDW